MPREIFVDTLFVVALLNERDAYYHKALQLADMFENQQLVMTDAVLLEIGNGLARGYKEKAIEVIDYLVNSSDVEIIRLTPQLFEQSYQLYRTYLDQR